MQFDYLHASRPAWFTAVRKFAVPGHLVHPLYALAAAVSIVAGSGLIERSRAHEAQSVESVYRAGYERSERAVHRAHVYSARVASLVALDKQVRSIVASGDSGAQKLADIADHLPPHAWLTSVTLDGQAMELVGRAKNFEIVGGIVRGLMHARRVQNPVLAGAQLVDEPARRSVVKYVIRLESGQ